MQEHDVVVVGAGLAGLTAGMVAAQHGLNVIVVDQMASGGQLLNIEKVHNVPGFPEGIAGYDLGPTVQEQAETAGAQFTIDTVQSMTASEGGFVVHCAEAELQAKAVILAAGSTLRRLGIPGEEELFGRGISQCASCDGHFFAGKNVCVVGGGDSALDEAAVLADQVATVRLIHRGTRFRAQQSIVDLLQSKKNVETLFGTEIVEIVGSDKVSGVKLRAVAGGEARVEPIDGVFVFVGLAPASAFLQGFIDLDPAGHIITNIGLQASVPGVFAAGDIRQRSVSLVASVIGDGATAAVGAYRYIKGI